MPVVDGTFVPRTPLVLAEETVDWLALDNHVLTQRIRVEARCRPAARRLAVSAAQLLIPARATVEELTITMELGLRQTLKFGVRSAKAELGELRRDTSPRAAHEVPDAGQHAREVLGGLEGVLAHVRRRSRAAAERISQVALAAAGARDAGDDSVTVVVAAVARSLHNHVLDLIGETLNLGRALGVTTLDRPPEFAMRSEQLDKGTCDPCARLHGEIVEVGSGSFYEYMPPAGCLGGGRCRGVYVFADGPQQMRGPQTEPGPQPELAPIPPVRQPTRRAA